MPKFKDLIPGIKDLPLGHLEGAAQDNVELAIARDIREMEVSLGQPTHTLKIPVLIATANEKHGLVPPENVNQLTTNIERAYDYVTVQTAMPIARAGYKSYQAEDFRKKVGEVFQQIGSALGTSPPAPKST